VTTPDAGHFATWSIAALVVSGVVVRPWRVPEWAWALIGAGVLVLSGLLPWRDAAEAVGKGLDVYLFLAGMMLTVLQEMGVRGYGFVAIPLATISYFIVSTPIAGAPTTSPATLSEALFKTCFYAVIAALAVAPLALGDHGWYSRLLASRPMVWLGEISYEIFLIHLITMEFAMDYVVGARVYTGPMLNLFVATLALTIPLAWLLHRFTRVRE